MTRVVVSTGPHGDRVFECLSTSEGFICRACGFGKLGYKPDVGQLCPQCGAKVEEVIEARRRR
jgi:rubrerythrin